MQAFNVVWLLDGLPFFLQFLITLYAMYHGFRYFFPDWPWPVHEIVSIIVTDIVMTVSDYDIML